MLSETAGVLEAEMGEAVAVIEFEREGEVETDLEPLVVCVGVSVTCGDVVPVTHVKSNLSVQLTIQPSGPGTGQVPTVQGEQSAPIVAFEINGAVVPAGVPEMSLQP